MNFLNTLPAEFIAVIAGALSSFVTYIIARRKTVAEAQSSEIDNVQKAIAVWRELAQSLEAKVDKLIEENTLLKQEVFSQKNEMARLEILVRDLSKNVKEDIASNKIQRNRKAS
jgi:predicted RNase H-like nuclease (RuvC/YqgF family)